MNDMSEELKHTPGPWEVLSGSSKHPGIEALGGALSVVIFGYNERGTHDDGGIRGRNQNEAIANAQLIAAAPDLLEALKAMVDKFDSEIHNEYDGTRLLEDRLSEANFARRIIAKAEGRAE